LRWREGDLAQNLIDVNRFPCVALTAEASLSLASQEKWVPNSLKKRCREKIEPNLDDTRCCFVLDVALSINQTFISEKSWVKSFSKVFGGTEAVSQNTVEPRCTTTIEIH